MYIPNTEFEPLWQNDHRQPCSAQDLSTRICRWGQKTVSRIDYWWGRHAIDWQELVPRKGIWKSSLVHLGRGQACWDPSVFEGEPPFESTSWVVANVSHSFWSAAPNGDEASGQPIDLEMCSFLEGFSSTPHESSTKVEKNHQTQPKTWKVQKNHKNHDV